MPAETRRPRRSQADRRAETRAALLAAAARGLSCNGYGNLNLAEVAAEAGYTWGPVPPLRRQGGSGTRRRGLGLGDLATAGHAPGGLARRALSSFGRRPGARSRCLLPRRTGARHDDASRRVRRARAPGVGDAVWKIAAELRQRVERLVVHGRRSGTIPPGAAGSDPSGRLPLGARGSSHRRRRTHATRRGPCRAHGRRAAAGRRSVKLTKRWSDAGEHPAAHFGAGYNDKT